MGQKRERFNDFRRDAALLQLQRCWGVNTEPSHSAANSQQVARNKLLEKTKRTQMNGQRFERKVQAVYWFGPVLFKVDQSYLFKLKMDSKSTPEQTSRF